MKKIFNIFLIVFLISFHLSRLLEKKIITKSLLLIGLEYSQIKIEMPQDQNFLNTS